MSARPLFPHLTPPWPFSPPCGPPPPPVVAATLGTHMAKTSLAVSFVCVCVCEIYRGVWRQTGQPAPPFLAPPAATIEPREMWADRLASSAKASRVLREVGEGGEGHGEKGKRKGAGRNSAGDFRTDAAQGPAGEARPLKL